MKFSTENDNNFGYEKITILVDNMPLRERPFKLKVGYSFYFHSEYFFSTRKSRHLFLAHCSLEIFFKV